MLVRKKSGGEVYHMIIRTVKASKSQRKEKERKVGVKATPPLSARFVKFQKQTYCLGATAPSADPIIAKRKVEEGKRVPIEHY